MVLNLGNRSISQMTSEKVVKLFKDGNLVKELPAAAGLNYQQLEKILNVYLPEDVKNEI